MRGDCYRSAVVWLGWKQGKADNTTIFNFNTVCANACTEGSAVLITTDSRPSVQFRPVDIRVLRVKLEQA